MSGGTAIALYAAVVATASLGWQIIRAIRAERIRVRVEVSYGVGVGGVPDLVIISVLNDSPSHPIRVTAAGIGLQDGTDRYVMQMNTNVPREYALPLIIAPKDAGETALPVPGLQQSGIDLYRPVVARVSLANGPWLYSEPRTLRKR